MPTLILILGRYGTGKSVSAATIGYLGKTIYYALDENINSIKTTKNEEGKLVISKKALDNIKFITSKDIRVEDRIRRPVFASVSKGEVAPPAPFYAENMYDTLMEFYTKQEEIFKETPDAVVIDSLSTYIAMHVNSTMTINNVGSLRIQDYGTINRGVMDAFLGNLKNLPCKWVIVVGHLKFVEDRNTGNQLSVPVTSSDNLSALVPTAFSEVYIQRRETTTPFWLTCPEGLYTGSTKLNVPQVVNPADFREISKFLQ